MEEQKQFTAEFITKLSEQYHVPSDPITLGTNLTTKELNSVILVSLQFR